MDVTEIQRFYKFYSKTIYVAKIPNNLTYWHGFEPFGPGQHSAVYYNHIK